MSGSHGSTGQHNQTMGGNRNGNMGSGNRNGTMGGNRNGTMGGNRNSTMGGNRNSTTGGTRNGNMGPNNKGFGNKGPANGMNNRGPAGRGGPGGMNARGPHVAPGRQVSLKGGGSAQIRPNGQIRSINRNGMQIQRGVRGERRIVSTRNGVRVVSVGRGRGYVQRAYFNRGGRAYYSRTYYYHGVYRTGVYRGYYWHGRPYYGYYPPYYYHPGYYGWVYNPWPAPVYYSWGWGPAPWYGYYGPYFAPYPVYPSAAFWITDFMIAATLQAAYEAQANAVLYPNAADGTLVASLLPMAAEGSDAVKLSPEVKNALAEEVKSETAAEQADASKSGGSASSGGQPSDSNEAPPALDPKFRYFVISSDETLVADGQECDLSQGDVIMRTSDAADDDGNVNVKVVGSSKSDCAVGTEGPIALDDLQEMYNQFRDQLKNGMAELAKKNGSGGLPKAPDTSTVTGDVPPPPPDKSAEKDLQEQQSAADQTESEVKQEAASDSGGGQ
ncbi:MAG TPA: hypothetical protein VMU61_15165 [Candidatus Aquilonibacter sp.]|nr:hypothetical protein [Candidatus Aquilonibacter sp.]